MSQHRVLIVLIVASVASALANDLIPLRISAELDLLNFMSRSLNIMQGNQKRSMSCVDHYMPLINDLTRQYEQNNILCSTNAIKARNDTEAATVPQQEELAKNVDSACGAVTQCVDGDSATSVFRCYVTESSKGSKALQGISNDATVQLATLNEALRRIDSTEKMCITDNRIEYEKDSTALYEQFTDCIYGVTEVPTKARSSPIA